MLYVFIGTVSFICRQISNVTKFWYSGKIVMTDYNKRTYRVDDVSWESSPRSTFKMKDETISYMDYYAKVIYFQ